MVMRASGGWAAALTMAEARTNCGSTLLLAHEDDRRIDRIPPEARAVEGEAARQRVVHLQADLQRALGGRALQRRARDRDLHQVSVRARFPETLVLELRVPGEDPAVVG